MYKLSFFHGNINPHLLVKEVVVYKDDFGKEKVNKFMFNGNQYMNVRIYPYIVLEIKSDVEKKETWSAGNSVSMDRFGMFKLIERSKELLENFIKEKSLYEYDSRNKLVLNEEIANKISIYVRLTFNKLIWIRPLIVYDEESRQEMEGVGMWFNNSSTYVTMTYDEYKFMVSFLQSIDVEGVAMNLITYAELTNGRTFTKLDTLNGNSVQQIPCTDAGQPEEKISGIGQIQQESTLPDI